MADVCETPIQAPKPKVTRKTAVFPIVGLVAFSLYISLFQVDIPAIIATAQTADPIPYALAIALSIVEVFFYSISWRVLLNFLSIKLSVMKPFLFVGSGVFLDIIVPAESVSGELVRVYLIQREQGVSSCGPAVASLVTHRLLGMAMNVAVLFVGMGFLFVEGQFSGLLLNVIIFLAGAITAILLLLIIFSFKEQWSLNVINWLIRAAEFVTRGRWKRLSKIKEDACRSTKSFHDSMKKFGRSPKPLALSLLGLSITCVFSLGVSYLVFLSLRTPVSWSVILITSAVVLAVKSIPVGIPFEVGLPEITMTTFYTGFGILPEVAATATVLNSIITLWLKFFIGLGAQQYLDLKPVLTVCANNINAEKNLNQSSPQLLID